MTTLHSPIPIHEIIVDERQRIDHSDTDGLRDSLAKFGTIQPLVLESVAGGKFRLIAGGRRLSLLKELGADTLYYGSTYTPGRPGYVFGSELTSDTLAELELEENIRRKEMTWQERVRGIAKIHRLKLSQGIPGRSWTQRLTGELFGLNVATVNQALALDAELRNPESPCWKLESVNDAHRHLLARLQARLEADLVADAATQSQTLSQGGDLSESSLFSDILPGVSSTAEGDTNDGREAAREVYLMNPHNDPEQFDSYWEEKLKLRSAPVKLYLSPRMWRGSCLDHMRERGPGFCDHIITDPPYAIDMDNLDQSNQAMANIDTVRRTHHVDANIQLLMEFIELAYHAIRDRGFLVMWADYERWQYLCSQGTAVGFRVQRWPFVWVKTHMVKNSMANHNFTKTTEIAVIMSKGGATLARTGPDGHIIAGHDEYKETMDHPFVKPFAAWEHLINAVSIQGQTIYEPFSGEGSGTLSIIRTGRQFLCSEYEETHYNKQVLHLHRYYKALNPNTEIM